MDLKDVSMQSLGAVEQHLEDMVKEGCLETGEEDALRILWNTVRQERERRQTPDAAISGFVAQATRQAANELRKAAVELEETNNLHFAVGIIRKAHDGCLGRIEHALEMVFDEMRKRR